jgi:hypothetical protein
MEYIIGILVFLSFFGMLSSSVGEGYFLFSEDIDID